MVNPEKKYTISDVVKITEYEAHVLRYYEKEFELNIPRNESNHRYYTYKEIETLNYIKSLQEKGFTNKQIKLILNSPEMLVDNAEEAAATSISHTNINEDKLEKISLYLKDFIIKEIKPQLINSGNSHLDAINDLKEEITRLREEINSKERDVLVCETAKLKLKVKEKSYEVAEMREKIKRLEYSNRSFINKIFRK